MAPNKPRPTKAQRREEARAKAKALREQQMRKEKRVKIARRGLIGAATLAVAGTVTYVVYDYLQDRDSDDASASSFSPVGTVSTAKANRKGVPTPVLADGSWTYGSTDTLDTTGDKAPVLDIFFDYSCHFCASFETTHSKEIQQLVDDKKITLALHPSKILKQEWTSQATNAMGVVLDEAPDQSLAFHTAVMELFGKIYESRDTSMMTTENLVSAATEAGVPEEVSAKFEKAISNNTYEEWITLSDQALTARGVKGTPAVFLDGEQLDLQSIGSETAITELVDKAASASGSATPGGGSTEQSTEQGAEQPS